MNLIESIGLCALRRLDPETAHGLALAGLRAGLVPLPGPVTSNRLRTDIAGLSLPNPIGIAAGFDKNATALNALARCGVGFVEVGAATPRPQPGNPRPRLFRLTEDKAAINRLGFNNDGVEAIAERLARRPRGAVAGLNLGANRDSSDRAGDFIDVMTRCAPYVDFVTVNVSSPNTAHLRDLQARAALTEVLDRVTVARAALPARLPVFVKIAPDLSPAALEDIAGVCLDASIDAIIATNSTVTRDGLKSPHAREAGGLSGRPLFAKSTRILAALSALTRGRMPLIGVGGVASAEDAYAKIRAGATAVQLYTGLVYGGLSLGAKIARGLDALLARDGHARVADAVGTGRADWL